MKNTFTLLFGCIVGVFSHATNAAPASNDFPHVVQFEIGDTEFDAGDRIEITEVRGSKATLGINETYAVSGKYTLSSRDEAELALFLTVRDSGPTKVDPKQRMRIKKGSGTFRLITTMHAEGYPHVSFYPVPPGSSFGGVYFGHGNWLLRSKGGSSVNQPGLSGPNQAIFKYLGEPVAPPPNLDPAYSREGLQRALFQAAKRAGVTIHSTRIDDSEFPFLLGLVSSGDFDRLGDELKKMEGYDFHGSVGHKTHHAFNITPWDVFPPESSQTISRRLGVRMQILADKIHGN